MRPPRLRRITVAVLVAMIGATAVAAQQGATRNAVRGNPREQDILVESDPNTLYLEQRLFNLEARLTEERARAGRPDAPSIQRMEDERQQLLQELARAQREWRGQGPKRPTSPPPLSLKDVQALNDEQVRQVIAGLCTQIIELERRVEELEEANKRRIVPCKSK